MPGGAQGGLELAKVFGQFCRPGHALTRLVRVFETEDAYVCEQSQSDKSPCKFKINKAILQQPINRAQAIRLLKDRMTDLLPKFISAKTGRPFSAYLVMDESGKVAFDFPERGAPIGQTHEGG